MKERLILSALMHKILDEIKESNGIKPPEKSTFSTFFVSFTLTKDFFWKVSSNFCIPLIVKHPKYTFCEPIFHPIFESESNGVLQVKLYNFTKKPDFKKHMQDDYNEEIFIDL